VTTAVLAVTHPHGAASVTGTGTYWFAIGLLVGIVAAMFAPIWVTALIIVFDLVALGWMFGILHFTDTGDGRLVWFALPFLGIGLFFGVVRGLKHLSEAEFRTRLGNIRRNGRFF
jgi:hypothetical protein